MGPRVHRRVNQRKLIPGNLVIGIRTRISGTIVNLLERIQLAVDMAHHLSRHHVADWMGLEIHHVPDLWALNLETVEAFRIQTETGR